MSCKILDKNTISDKEFLELMIKHHNVAIKMSQLIQMNSNDDYILNYARKIIYNQSMEVRLMENLLKSMPNIQNKKSCNCFNNAITGRISELYPGIFSNIKCADSHFENFGNTPIQLMEDCNYEKLPNKHIETFIPNLSNKSIDSIPDLTDKEYVDHMVAHHNSGIELAKLVLKTTQEPKILMFAQNIILDQEKEMFELAHLHNCIKYKLKLL
jgi:uncharacterized protein (DUF305 family)